MSTKIEATSTFFHPIKERSDIFFPFFELILDTLSQNAYTISCLQPTHQNKFDFILLYNFR